MSFDMSESSGNSLSTFTTTPQAGQEKLMQGLNIASLNSPSAHEMWGETKNH
jgi:hypothetical protein